MHIADCHIGVGDDCVTIKSGKDEAGRRVGQLCENITVTNCTMIHGHGGVVVGSEMSGGARNISVSNCVFQRTLRGIRLKTQRGRGGLVEGMVAGNIVMEDVPEPFSLTMYYSGGRRQQMAEPVGDGTPQFRNVLIQNILARGARTAGYILGLPEMPIAGVSRRPGGHREKSRAHGAQCRESRVRRIPYRPTAPRVPGHRFEPGAGRFSAGLLGSPRNRHLRQDRRAGHP